MEPRLFYIASWPRSGNTMLRILLEHFFGIRSVDDRTPKSGGFDIVEELRQSGALSTPIVEDFEGVKTHDAEVLPFQPVPALIIVRNPLDAYVSWAHYNREFRGHGALSMEEELERYAQGRMRFPFTWSEWNLRWIKGDVDCMRVWYQYEHLVTLLESGDMKALSRHLQYGLAVVGVRGESLRVKTFEAPTSFSALHAKNEKFFRRGRIGAHLIEMSQSVRDRITERERDLMWEYDYV